MFGYLFDSSRVYIRMAAELWTSYPLEVRLSGVSKIEKSP